MSTKLVTFRDDLERVAKRADALRDAAEQWIENYLIFLGDWLEVYDRAKKAKNSDAVKKLESLGTLDGKEFDKSTVSKIRKIVSGRKLLFNIKDSLPPSRDALYDFVKSYDRKGKSLTPKEFVKRFSISPNSSVRMIRNIGAKRSAKGNALATSPSGLSKKDIKNLIDSLQQNRVELNGIALRDVKALKEKEEIDVKGLTLLLVHKEFDQTKETDVLAAYLNVNDETIIHDVVEKLRENNGESAN